MAILNNPMAALAVLERTKGGRRQQHIGGASAVAAREGRILKKIREALENIFGGESGEGSLDLETDDDDDEGGEGDGGTLPNGGGGSGSDDIPCWTNSVICTYRDPANPFRVVTKNVKQKCCFDDDVSGGVRCTPDPPCAASIGPSMWA